MDWQPIREVMDDQARATATAARLGTTGALAMIAALSGRRGRGNPGRRTGFQASPPAGRLRSRLGWS